MTAQNRSTLILFLKAMLFTFLFVAVFTVISLGALSIFTFRQYQLFTQNAHTNWSELQTTFFNGRHETLQTHQYQLHFLILGVDSLANRGDIPPLTDTMMLVSVHTDTGKISMISLPRDLWSEEYLTKINALYAYGIDRYPEAPEQFPTEVISQMTGVSIQYPLVISMDHVAEIIDILGGIEINVEEGFTDPEFPRSDVDIQTEHDPAVLYKTVTFEPGKQIMNGERALEFIRSRHSEGDQGTDVARGQRQQQVIMALIATLKQKRTLTNPVVLGKLYAYYQTNFAHYFPMTQAIALAKVLYPVRNQIEFQQNQISVYPDDPEGIIYHPPIQTTQSVWVYKIRDLELFQQTIQEQL